MLRGAPIDLWVRLDTTPPASDPGATVAFVGWTFVSGVNDRPDGTRPGDSGTPTQALRMQWNDLTPVAGGAVVPFELRLRARVRVTYSDGSSEEFALNGSIAVTVRYQAATS